MLVQYQLLLLLALVQWCHVRGIPIPPLFGSDRIVEFPYHRVSPPKDQGGAAQVYSMRQKCRL